MMNFKSFWLFNSLLVVFCFAPVWAEEQDIEDLRSLSLEELMNVEVVTASKHTEKATDTPATIIVVTKQQIQQRHYINLIDLLQDLPGFDIQKGTKSAAYHNIILHGHQSNSRFLILQDGVRIDSPTRDKIPIADNFPLYHAKQVEILYGPASTLYGADAFGGVINIITEAPKDVKGVSLSSSLGSYGYQYQQIQAGVELAKEIDLVIGGHIHSADTADLSKYYPNEFAKVDATFLNGKVAVPASQRENYVAPVKSNSLFAKLTLGKNLTLGANHSFFRSSTNTGDKPQFTLFSTNAQWNTEINNIYANYQVDLTPAINSKTLIDYATYLVDPQSRYKNVFLDFHEGFKYAQGRKAGIEQQLGYRINQAHELIAGVNYEDFYVISVPDLPQPYDRDKSPQDQNMYYPNTNNTLPINMLDVHYSNLAFYLQLQSAWNDRFSTTLGLRYDKNSRYEDTFNPRLGFVYKFYPMTVFKLLYGEAFRAPTVDESAGGSFGSFSGKQNAKGEYISSQFRAPNPNLQPEKTRSLEFSLTHGFTNHLTTTLSSYLVETRNLVATRKEKTPTQFIPGAQILATTIADNLGKAQHSGIDLSVNYQTLLGKEWTGNFWANYSFIKGSVREGTIDVALPYIATHKLKLGSTFNYQNKYFLTPQVYLIDRMNTGTTDPKNPSKRLQTPAYALFNLHFGVNEFFSKGLSAYIDVYNVFDKRYYNAGGNGSTTLLIVPQPPRNLVFSLRYQF